LLRASIGAKTVIVIVIICLIHPLAWTSSSWTTWVLMSATPRFRSLNEIGWLNALRVEALV